MKNTFMRGLILWPFASDGVARSGVVCALWEVISRLTCDGEVDIYLAVRQVHSVRPEAIASVVGCPFVCLPVCLPVCLSACLSVCSPVCLAAYLSAFLSVYTYYAQRQT